MSLEQADLNDLDVDTRSDIYSLGVILYELLTGSTPLTRESHRQAAFVEVLKRIKEEEPERPSSRISHSSDSMESISSVRQIEPRKLSSLMKGELDWVVMWDREIVESFVTTCVGVSSGDTITVWDKQGEQLEIRIDIIDSPELDQPFGKEAKQPNQVRAICFPMRIGICSTNLTQQSKKSKI